MRLIRAARWFALELGHGHRTLKRIIDRQATGLSYFTTPIWGISEQFAFNILQSLLGKEQTSSYSSSLRGFKDVSDTDLCALADEKVPKKPTEGHLGHLSGGENDDKPWVTMGCWGSRF